MAGGYRSRDPLGVVLLSSKYDTRDIFIGFIILARLFWMDTIERASWRELFLFARLTSYSRVSAILLYVRNSSKVIYALEMALVVGGGRAGGGRVGGRWWPRHDAVAPRISNKRTQGTIIFYSKDNFN